jgi:hypothetical protein
MDRCTGAVIGRKHLLMCTLTAALLGTVFLTSLSSSPPAPGTDRSPGNAAIEEYRPALAVRGSGCITCHAEVYSPIITDFGAGDPYFFGNPAAGSEVGPFNGNIYGDFIAEQNNTGWATARFHGEIIVPEVSIDFSLEDAAPANLKKEPSYQAAFRASSLAGYLRTLESRKPEPATVVEKKKIYIGAADAATLAARFGMKPGDASDFTFFKTDREVSPDIEGIERAGGGTYYTNVREVVCDGDLFVRGTLLLNKPSIRTGTGCRIYATGPIFLEGAATFSGTAADEDLSNLQLMSAEAIFLGTGKEKCAGDGDPLSSRLLRTPALTSIFTRAAERRHSSPEAFMQELYDKASSVPLEDSSCHDTSLSLSRMLLNAPVIHCRYSGRFKGVVIAEFALFWQGKSSYEFDPVFRKVPVLPVLDDSDYLVVEP